MGRSPRSSRRCRRSAGTSSRPSSRPATRRCARPRRASPFRKRFALGRARDVRAAAAPRAPARPARAARCSSSRASAPPTTCCCCARSSGWRRPRWRSGGRGCRRCLRRGARTDGGCARAARRTCAPQPAPRRGGRRRAPAPRKAAAPALTRGSRAMKLWQPAYVGLGSNLSDPRARCGAALRAPPGRCRSRAWCCTSPLYALAALRPGGAAGLRQRGGGTAHAARAACACSRELRALETALGAAAARERWGPRVIDLDLLVFGRERCDGPELTLPHPGIVERNFVLYPLARHRPGSGRARAAAASPSSRRASRPTAIWRLDERPMTHGA